MCLESLGRRVDRGFDSSSLQPPTLCSLSTEGRCEVLIPAAIPPTSHLPSAPSAQHRWEALLAAHQDPTRFSWSTDISLMPTRQRWWPHTPALGHMVRLCPCNCWCGQEHVAQLQPMSHEGAVQLRGFRRETQTETVFFFSVFSGLCLLMVEHHIPRVPTPACSCACMWCQKLQSVQTTSRGRGKMKRQAGSSTAGSWKDPGHWGAGRQLCSFNLKALYH